jgi:hypothetical protein
LSLVNALSDAIHKELQTNLDKYNRAHNGADLLALRIEQNDELLVLLKKHRRALEFSQGKTVEPEVHFGEGVLIGIGGQ